MVWLLVTVSASSSLPAPLTSMVPSLLRMPLESSAVPIRLSVPTVPPTSSSRTVTVPLLTVLRSSVSVPVLSTVTVPPVLSKETPWTTLSAPPASTSMVWLLVTVSASSSLPAPLTSMVPSLLRMPLESSAVPIRLSVPTVPPTSSSRTVTVPLLTVLRSSVSVPVLSTVTVRPGLSKETTWTTLSAPPACTSMVWLLVTVSASSSLPAPLTSMVPSLLRMPLERSAVPIRLSAPTGRPTSSRRTVTVPLLTVLRSSVSVPVLSTVTVPPLLYERPTWTTLSAPPACTSMVWLLVTVSASSSLPAPLTSMVPSLLRMPLESSAVAIRLSVPTVPPTSSSRTVTVPLLTVLRSSVSVPVLSTVTVPPVLSKETPWTTLSAPPASTSMVWLLVTVSASSSLPAPLTSMVPSLLRMPLESSAVPIRLSVPTVPPTSSSRTVTVPLLTVLRSSVSVPVLSTVTVPPVLSKETPWTTLSAPPACTSMVWLLVTVSASSSLPAPLTSRVPSLLRMPLESSAVPIRLSVPTVPPTSSSRTVTVPLLTVLRSSVSVPVLSTVTVPPVLSKETP